MKMNSAVLVDSYPQPMLFLSENDTGKRMNAQTEKWKNDKALAIEFLLRQESISQWIETNLGITLSSRHLYESLRSGTILLQLISKLAPDLPKDWNLNDNYNAKMAPWKSRENITIFLKYCRSYGFNDLFLFDTDDLYEGTNMIQVLFCLNTFARFAAGKGFTPLKPVQNNDCEDTFDDEQVEKVIKHLQAIPSESKLLTVFKKNGESVLPNNQNDEVHYPPRGLVCDFWSKMDSPGLYTMQEEWWYEHDSWFN